MQSFIESLDIFVKDAYGYDDPKNVTIREFIYQPRLEINRETSDEGNQISFDAYIYLEVIPKKMLFDATRQLVIYKEKRVLVVLRNNKKLKWVQHALISVSKNFDLPRNSSHAYLSSTQAWKNMM